MQKAIKAVTAKRYYKTESPMELKIVNELIKYDGIGFTTQYKVGPFRLDFAILPYKLALEVDGMIYHWGKEKRAKDALKDEYLKDQGWTVERVPGWLCNQSPEMAVLKMLRHYPDIEKWNEYEHAKVMTYQWLARDLYNQGDIEQSNKVISSLINEI